MRVISKNNLHQLTFFPTILPVNCYVIEEDHSLTLIDAALPGSEKGIQKFIQQNGKPLTHIVLTHIHSDHIGALDALAKLYPEAVIGVSTRDARLMSGDRSLDPGEPQTPIRGGIPKKLRTRASLLLEDGDRIGSLQVITTPGHTPGSISLLDTRSHALIAGDAFQTRGGIAVSGSLRWIFPFPALATWSKAISLQSAQRLLDLNPSLLAVGHGSMITEPIRSMQKAIDRAARKA
ncbi:MBL fold metallo-hydrolase [Paenibacillus wenxiniae]|uniref:MBL fold metallo-hydrolase n=1 Tax=Paenibacillus wenxiniae TaxID=1636843 RepID=A0ABW4RNP3_9BACL